MSRRTACAAAIAALGALVAVPVADAATFRVDDDRADCPAAPYTSVQAAIDAAGPGDTIVICPGTYVEGTGAVGSNALTIGKSLVIKGAGADEVAIMPRAGATLLEPAQDIRNGVGDIVSVVGDKALPIKVDISGVTIRGNGAVVEAGVVYLDAYGTFSRNAVKQIVTSELAADDGKPGAYRSGQFGYGVAHVTANTTAASGARTLTVTQSRVEQYNRIGVLIDGARNDAAPFLRSGVVNRGIISNNSIVGRLLCTNFQQTGNCSSSGQPGNNLVTTGTLFGQDGIRIVGGAAGTLTGNTISQNLVGGAGAPVRHAATNNANLNLGAGIRLIDAQASSASRNNIVDNAYGAFNVEADGSTPNESVPFAAENNWWGLRAGAGGTLPNAGPAISPTTNPPFPENPVNGFALPDGAGTSSTAVDFFPHRNGAQGDGINGAFTVFDAPLPVDDAAPTASLTASKTVALKKDSVVYTALADDDFGIKKVTFYDGSVVLGTDTLPPYTHTLSTAENAVCASHTITAVVEDSQGQTAASSVPLTVDCGATYVPPTDTTNPLPTTPAKPTIPGTLPALTTSGALVSVAPVAPGGIAAVDFFLGARKVCTRTAAPFECRVDPTGADVGTQALRVVVTDALGQTGETSRAVQIARFKVAKVSITAGKLKATSKTKGWRITTRVGLPSRVTTAQGCTGRVTLVLKRGSTTIANSQVSLKRDCTVAKSIRVAKRGTYQLTARFEGNSVLLPAGANRRLS